VECVVLVVGFGLTRLRHLPLVQKAHPEFS
jgi:hypothetical protein